MAFIQPVAKLRVSRDIIDAARAIYPRVLSTVQTGWVCPTCGECCCEHEAVELTVMGHTLEQLDTSVVVHLQENENATEVRDVRLVAPYGIYIPFCWVQQQPYDALPPTDFIVPPTSPTSDDDNLELGAEASNLIRMDASAVPPVTDDTDLELGAEASNLIPQEVSAVVPPTLATDPVDVKPGKPKGLSRKERRALICQYCVRNGETKEFYRGHLLAENGRVTCPILRAYICPLCQATGDNAHTLQYCPTGMGPKKYPYSTVRNAFGKLQKNKR